jgi:putative PIN family toxin of toxin-antitoxin system
VRAVIDTNVFVSGIFWSGPPYEILKAWRDRTICLITSPEILAEYKRVAIELNQKCSNIDVTPMIDLVTMESEIIRPKKFKKSVCRDQGDDIFLECALSGNAHALKNLDFES